MKKIILLLIILMLPAAYAQCTDSDKVGMSFYNQGYVEYEGETYTDYCTGNELTEYKCEDDTMAFDTLNCDYGCVNGACLESISCSGLKQDRFMSDGMDVCYNPQQMKNYYCSSNQATFETVDCQFGCADNHCLTQAAKPANCKGTDYLNSCGDLVADDCLHCGFECGDYQCIEILDDCGMGSTGTCIKLDGTKILVKKTNQAISVETGYALSLVSNRIMVNGVDLQTYPDKIYDKVAEAGYTVLGISLRAGDMTYEVEAVKTVKVLGLFSKEMKAKIEVSSLPKAEVEVDKPWWGFLGW